MLPYIGISCYGETVMIYKPSHDQHLVYYIKQHLHDTWNDVPISVWYGGDSLDQLKPCNNSERLT